MHNLSVYESGTGDNVSQKCTGQERDPETVLDFFQARYYGNMQGRFMSPDPWNASADPANPQSWNGYSYVFNSPLTLIDPNGLDPTDDPCDDDPDSCGSGGWFPIGGVWGGSGTTQNPPLMGPQPSVPRNTTGAYGNDFLDDGATDQTQQWLAATVPLLETARSSLLRIVTNSTLRNHINNLYRAGARIGDGSSMAAAKEELQYGVRIAGKQHIEKLITSRNGLVKLLGPRAGLNSIDQSIVRRLLIGIQDALSGIGDSSVLLVFPNQIQLMINLEKCGAPTCVVPIQ